MAYKIWTATIIAVLAIAPAFAVIEAQTSENYWVAKAPCPILRIQGVAVVEGKVYAMTSRGENAVYDPATNTWNQREPMPTPRDGFGIAVWHNLIYVIGGTKGNINGVYAPLSVNEVYDPATGNWETKASMPIAQAFLTANTVNDKIYLIGGALYTSGPPWMVEYNSNQIYHPENDTWTNGAPIPIASGEHASAVIDDEIFIVAGGGTVSNRMQIYNTKSNTWSSGSPLPVAERSPGVAATSGKIIAKRLFVIGGSGAGLTQIYNPETQSWTTGAKMITPRNYVRVGVENDVLYAIGGISSTNYTYQASNEAYYPSKTGAISPPATSTPNSWSSKVSMPYAPYPSTASAAALNGKIYLATTSGHLNVYDPNADSWTEKSALPQTENVAIAACEGKIFSLQESQVYDPENDTWKAIAKAPEEAVSSYGFAGVQPAVVGSKIYLIGGFSAVQLEQFAARSTNLVYDVPSNSWSTMTPIPTAVVGYACAVLDGKIYILGGQSSDGFGYGYWLNFVQIFDPHTNSWTQGAPMPTTLGGMGACSTSGNLAAKRIYLVGGKNKVGCVDWTQIYDPYTGSWSFGEPMPYPPRTGLSLVNVNDKLYALGGEDSDYQWLTRNDEYTPPDYDKPTPTLTLTPSPAPTSSSTPPTTATPTSAATTTPPTSNPTLIPSPTPTPTPQPTTEPPKSTTPTETPTTTPSPTESPKIPELPAWIILPIAALLVAVWVLIKRKFYSTQYNSPNI